jgi:hypothetical protein
MYDVVAASFSGGGWTPSVLEKTSVKVWGEGFRGGREGWRAAA